MMLFLLIGKIPFTTIDAFQNFISTKDHWQEPLKCNPQPDARSADMYKRIM
jgi:hypothetical protein